MTTQQLRYRVTQITATDQGNPIENRDSLFEYDPRSMQRTDGFPERSKNHAARRMDMANRLHIRPGFVNPRVNPKLRVWATVARKLIASTSPYATLEKISTLSREADRRRLKLTHV